MALFLKHIYMGDYPAPADFPFALDEIETRIL